MARRTRVRPFVRPPSSTKMWFDWSLAQASIPTGSVATLLGTLNAAALLLRPFTILRTRTVLQIGSDQFASTENNNGVWTCQVVTDSATAAGIASVPTPLDEASADYFIYQAFQFDVAVGDTTGFLWNRQKEYVIDSKAMRKVLFDDDVAIVVDARNAAGFNVGMEGRMLVKLH